MPVKGIEVLSRIRQDLLQAALGAGNAGKVGNGLDRSSSRCSGKMLDTPGRERSHAEEFHRSEDGGERAGAKPAMGVEHLAVWRLEAQSEFHIAGTREAASGSGGAGVAPRGLWLVAGTRSGGGAVGERWRNPARTEAERTRGPLSNPYGTLTVSTAMPRTRAANSEARRPQSSAVLERQARRFLESKGCMTY